MSVTKRLYANTAQRTIRTIIPKRILNGFIMILTIF
jgi:hypothetical protein